MPSNVGAQSSEPTEDFKIKGFHLDLRIQVMTPQALKELADELSGFGINTLIMEWEGTYPYKKHAVISNEYSYTREEITDFIAYCDDLGIKVIPLQQSLGHVEYILRNPRYSHLKEDRKDISQLCPMEAVESKSLFKDLFSDLVETHNSDYIHIGGDETYLLGHCEKCQLKVKEEGKSKLFVDYMKMITELVIELGKKPVMWADIILKHPEAASELPKETIFVDWNYGWKINHFGDIPKLQEMGFTFWGAPAIRCHPDNWYVTDWTTHFKNQKDFIPYAREAGYEGMVITSWSTTGVYGFTWDVGYDVIDMVQIRNTYPLSAFRILIASYAKALDMNTAINPQDFVVAYASDRFGFNKAEALKLWDFLSAEPELISNGHPTKSESIAKMKETYNSVRKELLKLKTKQNEAELSQFKLMADLRMHYLDFKEVEFKYNAPNFLSSQAPVLLKELDVILLDAKRLNKRFLKLNKGFLYDSELKEQNELRVQAVHVLYDRLSKLK
ncbi:N-acetyl-beta-hexosaminidase [Pseudalgibacter alginicilyticus]|uniref:N-acetyl-beta-hexosaminidase n=1 Tax=Pseudalgibacter alginicilyticus TaxID=1736674 RepID=A0A0N7HZ12_9FLAO|nr:family 20 glycosylhydrolase [Pseudalgibacter alginicilyticus]ALJ06766.1 N-acetyl-beta-hexosaminidase [Pseudalgibacter alginicilyticus]